MAHTQIAIIFGIGGMLTLILVAMGILAPFPNTASSCSGILAFGICFGITTTQINPLNWIVPAAFFLFTPIVWWTMGKAEREIKG